MKRIESKIGKSKDNGGKVEFLSMKVAELSKMIAVLVYMELNGFDCEGMKKEYPNG